MSDTIIYVADLPEPEPAPATIIAETACHGVHGKVGAIVAEKVIINLTAAGFEIRKMEN